MARLFDRLSDFQLNNNLALKALIDAMQEQIEAQFDSQQGQIDDINAILDPNTLTPDKKPTWIFQYAVLTGEQSGIDAEATSYGITTQKTNYDSAITALTTYLNTLTTDVDWDDESGNTTIVATTFRSKFNDVLTKRQILLNKIAANAKVLADAAAADAASAAADAASAASDAAAAQSDANAAQSDATASYREAARINSYCNPGAVLSATDAGSNASITVANHTRVYPIEGGIDVPDVSITGNTLTGKSYSTLYYIYYDDTTLADTTPTFVATTSAATAQVGAHAGRHIVGFITTPASGGGGTSGFGSGPPGGGGGAGPSGGYLP